MSISDAAVSHKKLHHQLDTSTTSQESTRHQIYQQHACCWYIWCLVYFSLCYYKINYNCILYILFYYPCKRELGNAIVIDLIVTEKEVLRIRGLTGGHTRLHNRVTTGVYIVSCVYNINHSTVCR